MIPRVLSIVIPMVNEADRILPTLQTIEKFLKTQSYESQVILVDDGSTDQTVAVVQDFVQSRPQFHLIESNPNKGKGHAVKTGMLKADGDVHLFSDADLSTPIEEVNKLLPFLDDYPVVIASRRLRGAQLDKRQPLYREASGRVFSVLVRLILFGGYLDTQCGFKLFTKEASRKIFQRQTLKRFAFDVEILFIALKKCGLKVKEVPVRWINSKATKVQLVTDSLDMFWDLLRIRWRNIKGVYDRLQ